MPEIQMYDEQGRLTLDGMKAEHAAGRSVLWSNAAGKPILIRPGEQLPSDAEMAKGKPAQEEAVRQSLQAQIAELQNQMNMLGKETRASYAQSTEQLTGNLPGLTAIHPDMVGAYPPQRGDGAQPLDASEVPAEHQAAVGDVVPVAPADSGEAAPESDTPPSGGGYDQPSNPPSGDAGDLISGDTGRARARGNRQP